jgi:hypothetical protein
VGSGENYNLPRIHGKDREHTSVHRSFAAPIRSAGGLSRIYDRYRAARSGSLIALQHEDGDVSLDMEFRAAAYQCGSEACSDESLREEESVSLLGGVSQAGRSDCALKLRKC